MKRTLLISALFVALLTGCDVRNKDKTALVTKETVAPEGPTTVEIIDSVYDFGTITEGEIAEFSFRFKNTGTNPLVVTNASASCGCTVPEKPEQPIRPGETGYIKAKFNSDKRPGEQYKTIVITSNANPSFPELKMKGKVNPKPTN